MIAPALFSCLALELAFRREIVVLQDFVRQSQVFGGEFVIQIERLACPRQVVKRAGFHGLADEAVYMVFPVKHPFLPPSRRQHFLPIVLPSPLVRAHPALVL